MSVFNKVIKYVIFTKLNPAFVALACCVSTLINNVLPTGGRDTVLMRRCSDWLLGEGVQHWSHLVRCSRCTSSLFVEGGVVLLPQHLSEISVLVYYFILTSHRDRIKNRSLRRAFAFYGWCGFFCGSCTVSLPLHSSSTPSYFMTTKARKKISFRGNETTHRWIKSDHTKVNIYTLHTE